MYHANGKDIWIIGHEWGNNNFFLYLLTKEGFVHCPIIKSVGIEYKKHSIFSSGLAMNQGFIKFSPNSIYMAHVFTPGDPQNIFSELYQFNAASGEMDLISTIPLTAYPWATEFTSNNQNLLISQRDSPLVIYNIPTQQLKSIDSFNFPYSVSFQRSIDGLIYFGFADSTFVGTIEGNDFENIIVTHKSVNLLTGKMQYGFPNIFSGYILQDNSKIVFDINCSEYSFEFTTSIIDTSNVYKWIFSHQTTIDFFESYEKNPSVIFSETGNWNVLCLLSNSDTVLTTVFIESKVDENFLGNDTGWCSSIGAPITLQAPIGMHCYQWNTGETSSQITADTVGVYVAKITTSNFCVYYDTVIVSVDSTEAVESNFLGEDKSWCQNIDTTVVLKAPDGFNHYLWSTNESLQEISVSEEGVYIVKAIKRNQCESGGNLIAIDTITITLLNNVSKPILNRLEDSLFVNVSGNNNRYKWYRNNSLLSDTTEYLILPDTGSYFLKIINENNCESFSDTLFVANLGLSLSTLPLIKFYPNPANNEVIIEVFASESYTYQIIGSSGLFIKRGILNSGQNHVNISGNSGGVYFVQIYKENSLINTYKLIVLKD